MDEARTARRNEALRSAALAVLLDRVGGSISYTEADYQKILARYGGASRFNVRLEVVKEGRLPPRVEVRLEEKAPRNAELVS